MKIECYCKNPKPMECEIEACGECGECLAENLMDKASEFVTHFRAWQSNSTEQWEKEFAIGEMLILAGEIEEITGQDQGKH